MMAAFASPYDWSPNATPLAHWIGGHSQRSASGGDSATELRRILSAERAAGVDTSIAEVAAEVARVVGFRGEIRFDRSRPDGMPFKGLDSSVLHGLGWRPAWTLASGLEETYRWYQDLRLSGFQPPLL